MKSAENLLIQALHRKNSSRPPVWMMRQAGRYHSHYQALRKKHSFMDLCKKPKIACEATLGPIRDFDFDAAILFSDLLFPLECMGMGLRYEEGPQLDWHLLESSDLKKLSSGASLASGLHFQAEALSLIRRDLDSGKSLLGFVGGPFTLFCYAVEGRHQGNLKSARSGLVDGRFSGFYEKLRDLLIENMRLQAEAGADAIAIMDTCAGELDPVVYSEQLLPVLSNLLNSFLEICPGTPLIYYSKGTGPEHWKALKDLPFACLGVDWKTPILHVLENWGSTWAIQGNIDPNWLFLDSKILESNLRDLFKSIRDLPLAKRQGWICGLGHGILPQTPENHVRLFMKIQREIFSGDFL